MAPPLPRGRLLTHRHLRLLTFACTQLMGNRHLASFLKTWIKKFAAGMAHRCFSLPSLANGIVWLGAVHWDSPASPAYPRLLCYSTKEVCACLQSPLDQAKVILEAKAFKQVRRVSLFCARSHLQLTQATQPHFSSTWTRHSLRSC